MTDNQSPRDENGKLDLFSVIMGRTRPALFKMAKEGEEDFYFDSTDLSEHKQEFQKMAGDGWKLVDGPETLPSYLQARLSAIKEFGLVPFGWGYRKK